jgi:hypothetical protein
MIPTKRQWKRWTLPSKHSAISLLVGLIGLAFAIFVYIEQEQPVVEFQVNDSHVKQLFGFWKTTSIDNSFAEGRPFPDRMDESLNNIAPSFDLNSDESARIFIGGNRCTGTWKLYNNIVDVECPGYLIQLERKGETLITLPNREFILEKQ